MTETFLTGKTVVFTGVSGGPGTGTDARKAVVWCGGEFSTVLNKDTGILVYGSKAGSRLQKAQALGVEVMTFTEFNERVFDLTFNNNNMETGAETMDQITTTTTAETGLLGTVEIVGQQETLLNELREISYIFRYGQDPTFCFTLPHISLGWDVKDQGGTLAEKAETSKNLSSTLGEALKLKILAALPDMVKEVMADSNSNYEESLKHLQHLIEQKANEQLKMNPPAPVGDGIGTSRAKLAADTLKNLNISNLKSADSRQAKALIITETLKDYLVNKSKHSIKVYLKAHTDSVFSATVYSVDHAAVIGLESVNFSVCQGFGINLDIVVNPPLVTAPEDLVLDIKGSETLERGL